MLAFARTGVWGPPKTFGSGAWLHTPVQAPPAHSGRVERNPAVWKK